MPKEIKNISAPTYQKWLERIKTIAPALFAHMERRGRGATVVAAALQASVEFGQKALAEALKIVEMLYQHGSDAVASVLEQINAKVADGQSRPELLVVQMVIAAASGPPISC